MPLSIIIGGDLVPTKSNEELFVKGDAKELVGDEVYNILNLSDINIYNLETPLVDHGTPIVKHGNAIKSKTKTINGIKALKPVLLCLANNHIMDYGSSGLKSTMDTLASTEIGYIGAGENLEAAQKPSVIERNGIKVGVYNCAEHEFSVAEEQKGGANPFDVIESYKHVQELRLQCDVLIVIHHGGKEYYRYPSPNLQKFCRHFVDCGADLVVTQHSHCIGCFERYGNSTIVYGQGNFMFDKRDNEFWQTSLLIRLKISDTKDITIDYLPIVKCKNLIRYADDHKGREILGGFNSRSKMILEQGFIDKKYSEFAMENLANYIVSCTSIVILRLFLRVFSKVFGMRAITMITSRNSILGLLNILQCEAHNELLITGLKQKYGI
jgi:poly-gamma-glutamate synthesis protein (capsule biosynthesis protein)